jgi:hypothetical protein
VGKVLIDTTVVSHLKALRGTAPAFQKREGKQLEQQAQTRKKTSP